MSLDTATATPDDRPHWPYPRWIAHRGAGRLAPENTLAAFRMGAQHGYRMFECDVKLSADGVPFLMHDATLARTTRAPASLDARGNAGDHPWAVLSQLDAGGWHSRAFAGEPLPTLDNVARFCLRNGHCLNIEIKPTPGTAPAMALRTCRAACCSTPCGPDGWKPHSDWVAPPSSATTRCGTHRA
jgi:glycerophosphoryl diester phosphodiesterase